MCPTNGDSRYDKPVKNRAPVGIPKSMLKRVAPAPAEGADGEPSAGLVDADGYTVTMVADDAQFRKATEKVQPQLETTAVPDELKCPITKTLFRNAVLLRQVYSALAGMAASALLPGIGRALAFLFMP